MATAREELEQCLDEFEYLGDIYREVGEGEGEFYWKEINDRYAVHVILFDDGFEIEVYDFDVSSEDTVRFNEYRIYHSDRKPYATWEILLRNFNVFWKGLIRQHEAAEKGAKK